MSLSNKTTKNIFDDDVSVPGLERPNAQVEIFDKVTDEIYNKEDIELKTDLNDRQIVAMSSAKVFAKKYNMNLLDELVDHISLYSVSRGRKGRKEFENIAKANLGMRQEESSPSIPGRLFGRQ